MRAHRVVYLDRFAAFLRRKSGLFLILTLCAALAPLTLAGTFDGDGGTYRAPQLNDGHLVSGYNYELEPGLPLIATHPYAAPKPGDEGYRANCEANLGPETGTNKILVRLFRRGVFVAYGRLTKGVPAPPPNTSGLT
jgi:hypothetical protein